MSELSLNYSPEEGPNGFLQLYNAATGEIIPASPADLLRLEAQDIDQDLMIRIFGVPQNISGVTGVLISDRPGFISAAIPYHVYPEEFEGRQTEVPEGRVISIGWDLMGIAGRPDFDVERIIEDLGRKQLAPNVENLIRSHVSYREGQNPEVDQTAMWNLTLLDADDITRNLMTLSDIDPTDILGLGSQATIIEVLMAVTFYCGEAGLEDKEEEVLARILPEEEHNRVRMQIDALAPQFGEEHDLDAELLDIQSEEEQE